MMTGEHLTELRVRVPEILREGALPILPSVAIFVAVSLLVLAFFRAFNARELANYGQLIGVSIMTVVMLYGMALKPYLGFGASLRKAGPVV